MHCGKQTLWTGDEQTVSQIDDANARDQWARKYEGKFRALMHNGNPQCAPFHVKNVAASRHYWRDEMAL